MAKYTITHSCGCTVDHQIVGTNVNGQRERKAEWLEGQECRECKRRNELEAAQAASTGLVALTGSEKQIAWATKIRADAKKVIDEGRERAGNNLPEAARKAIETMMAQSAASWWIDRRDNGTILTAWLDEARKFVESAS